MANSTVPARVAVVHRACEPHAGPVLSREDAKVLGLKRYFTGKPCPHGHIVERRVSTMKCIQCCRDEFTAWAKSNPERMRERAKVYADRYPEGCAERKRKWVLKNKSHVYEQRKSFREANATRIKSEKHAHYLKNKDSVISKKRAWNRANPERVKIVNYRWRDANPDAAKAITHRRRAKRAGAEGSYCAADISKIFSEQSGFCAGCGKDISTGYHVDHMLPLSRGGSNWPVNLQLLCATCNTSKGALTMEEWLSSDRFRSR